MKKILLVEDQPDKQTDIVNLINSLMFSDVIIDSAASLRSGLSLILSDKNYDLILLDMSMPLFDSADTGMHEDLPESFAGREVIMQMAIRDIHTPVVVITQYSIFEKGNISLAELDAELSQEAPEFYKGCVYYKSSSSDWKKPLSEYIGNIIND